MNIMSSGLECPQCAKSWSFSSDESACIRLYARCLICAENDDVEISIPAIKKNQRIWILVERKTVFGENYAG